MAKYLSIPALFEQLTGQRPNPSTIWRWSVKGSQGVRLQTWMIGGRRLTTREAVEEFIAARTELSTPSDPAVTQDRATAELNKLLGV